MLTSRIWPRGDKRGSTSPWSGQSPPRVLYIDPTPVWRLWVIMIQAEVLLARRNPCVADRHSPIPRRWSKETRHSGFLRSSRQATRATKKSSVSFTAPRPNTAERALVARVTTPRVGVSEGCAAHSVAGLTGLPMRHSPGIPIAISISSTSIDTLKHQGFDASTSQPFSCRPCWRARSNRRKAS
jgi:hypothetical protein